MILLNCCIQVPVITSSDMWVKLSGLAMRKMPPINPNAEMPLIIVNRSPRKKWEKTITKIGAPWMMECTLPMGLSRRAQKMKDRRMPPTKLAMDIKITAFMNQWRWRYAENLKEAKIWGKMPKQQGNSDVTCCCQITAQPVPPRWAAKVQICWRSSSWILPWRWFERGLWGSKRCWCPWHPRSSRKTRCTWSSWPRWIWRNTWPWFGHWAWSDRIAWTWKWTWRTPRTSRTTWEKRKSWKLNRLLADFAPTLNHLSPSLLHSWAP